MSALLIAVVVALTSTTGPILLAIITGRQRTMEKQAEWARQDELDLRYKNIDSKLDTVKKIVDGAMTAQMQSELEGLKRELVMLRRLAGKTPTNDELVVIETTEQKIQRLNDLVNERLKIQEQGGY